VPNVEVTPTVASPIEVQPVDAADSAADELTLLEPGDV
jgi:hypothetical protein